MKNGRGGFGLAYLVEIAFLGGGRSKKSHVKFEVLARSEAARGGVRLFL